MAELSMFIDPLSVICPKCFAGVKEPCRCELGGVQDPVRACHRKRFRRAVQVSLSQVRSE